MLPVIMGTDEQERQIYAAIKRYKKHFGYDWPMDRSMASDPDVRYSDIAEIDKRIAENNPLPKDPELDEPIYL